MADLETRMRLTCFKAYDIRAKLGADLNEDIAYRIGRSVAERLKAAQVVIGFDARETSPMLAQAAARGVRAAGADVLDIWRYLGHWRDHAGHSDRAALVVGLRRHDGCLSRRDYAQLR